MKRPLRGGFALVELLGMLPLMLGVMMVGYEVSAWLLRVQRVESTMLSDQARMRDITRRIQADAVRAGEAVVRRGEDGANLELRRGDSTVVYRFADDLVQRTEQSGEQATTHYEWRLENAVADVRHETVAASPGVVWVLFTFRAPIERGRGPDYRLATATAVGHGGAS